jgi:hypothetical protein
MIEADDKCAWSPERKSSLIPHCCNCNWYFGYEGEGWCRQWDVFVKGDQDCCEFEMRNAIVFQANGYGEMLDTFHDFLGVLGEVSERLGDEQTKKSYHVMELAVLKFLRVLRKQLLLPYPED